jgi:hypothetical protein
MISPLFMGKGIIKTIRDWKVSCEHFLTSSLIILSCVVAMENTPVKKPEQLLIKITEQDRPQKFEPGKCRASALLMK